MLAIPTTALGQVSVTPTHIVTHHDIVPRFCNAPDATAVVSGSWADPAIWSNGSVPAINTGVRIATDVVVTYSESGDVPLDCVEIADRATLRLDPVNNTQLRLSDLQVLPGGTLQIGSALNPIGRDVSAEIVFRDTPLEVDGKDPEQYGNGLHVFGSLSLYGRPLARTFLRLQAEVDAGATEVDLEAAADGWFSGDRLLIPDTRQIPFLRRHTFVSEAEEFEIDGIDTNTVVLTQALDYDHHGPRDAAGNVGSVERDMLPHVANLSRNIIIRSTNPASVGKTRYCSTGENIETAPSCVTRGHVMVHARAKVDAHYTMFQNLGRTGIEPLDNTRIDDQGAVETIGTNQAGRYSFHVHQLSGPVNPSNSGYQFRLIGNVVDGFLKWGIVVHNSHYGLLRDNIVYDGQGSAIATEQGNESFNVFERNFVVHTKAGTSERIIESPGRAGVNVGRSLFGFTRDGFWFSGAHNYVRDNVVANAPGFAYNYNGYYLTQRQPVPNFRGADMQTDSTIQVALPILESTRNEAYGATGQGLWLTWSRGCCRVDTYREVNLFKDYRIWHVNNAGIEAFHESRNTFEGFVLRNDSQVTAQSGGGSLRFNRGFNLANFSYENGQTILSDIDVQGFNIGVQLPMRPEDGTAESNETRLEDSYLKNYVNVQERLPNIDVKRTILRNTVFEPLQIPAIGSQPEQPLAIEMHYSLRNRTRFPGRTSATIIYDFNGVANDNFELYFEQQAPDHPIPPPSAIDHPLFQGCPESGLTNLQCWNRHGVAIGGRVAPCLERDGDPSCAAARARAATRGIVGLLFPLRDDGGPPTSPRNLTVR